VFGARRFAIQLDGFCAAEEAMLNQARKALEAAGYVMAADLSLVRIDLPPGYRGMTLGDGAALGEEAFSSQDMLNHVLEEELLHLRQKSRGQALEFAPGTMRSLEEEVHEARHFRCPDRPGQGSD
jgi:hypothetical protein